MLLGASWSSQAANVYWLGTTDGNWTTTGNWSGTISGNTVVYDSQATGNLTQTLGQNWAINGISVVNPAGGITLNSGNTLTNSGGIDMSSAGMGLTNKAAQVLAAAQTWTVGGSGVLTNTGTINNNGYALTLNPVNGGNVIGLSSGLISGSGPVIKTGAGTLYWGGGSYTGGTFINGGTNISIADYAGALWTPVTMNGNSVWVFNGKQVFLSTLTLTNATCGINKNGNLNVSNVVSSGNSVLGVSEVRIGAGTSGYNNTNVFNVVDGTLGLVINRLYGQNNATGNVVKVGSGTLVFSNNFGSGTPYNNYAWNGVTILKEGVFQVMQLANSGLISQLGSSTNAAGNLVLNGGTLKYAGPAVSFDRLFSLGVNGGTLDASGTGAWGFTNAGAMGFIDTGAHTLTLAGTNAGANTLAVAIGDNGGPTTLVKTGPGCWVLGGTNSYTGSTILSNGTLLVSGICTMNNATNFDIAAGTSFGITNRLSANLTNRLKDTASVTMNGGTFKFLNDGSAVNFSETVGPLIVNDGANTVVVSPGSVGHTSVLTFKSLAQNGAATVDFQIADPTTTRVFFSTTPSIGAWVTVNGGPAAYTPETGLVAAGAYTGQAIVGYFTGGDLGEGLDFQGNFAISEYYGGYGAMGTYGSLQVQNAIFEYNGSRTGGQMNGGNDPYTTAPNFGSSQDDQNAALICNTFDQAVQPSQGGNDTLSFSVPANDGQDYKLQLIFHDAFDGATGVRPMSVTIGSQLVVPSLDLAKQGACLTQPKGVVISYRFTGKGYPLPVKIVGLKGDDNGPALLNAMSLEALPATASGVPYLVGPLAPQSVLAGSTVLFAANVGGVQGSYNWQKQVNGSWITLANGGNIAGADTCNLVLSLVTTNDAGNYRFVASNSAGSVTSGSALLTVIPLSPHMMIGHWISGPQSLADTAGFAPVGTHDGVVVGATETFAWSPDVPAGFEGGYSIDLSAGDVAVAIANSKSSENGYWPTFDGAIANSFTIAFWAKGWPGSYMPFVSKRGENDMGYQIRPYAWFLYPDFTLRGTAGSDDTTSAYLVGATSNAWHHYAGTWDGVTGVRRLYVDNVLAMVQYSDFGPMTPASNDRLVLGARDSGGVGTWSRSKLFDVQVYGYALSTAEVQAINRMSNAPIANAVVTGPAAGQGLNLQGVFATAEYYGNPAGPVLPVGNAYFLPSTRAGGTASSANLPNFGSTPDQLNLAQLSYRNVSGVSSFTLPATTVGTPYRLQLLYHDNSSTAAGQRLFNVQAVSGTTTNFLGVIDCAAAGANLTNALDIVASYAFTGDGNPLTITETAVSGSAGSPILNALTLEDLSPGAGDTLRVVSPIASKWLFVGDTAQFAEIVTGSQLSYAWQKLSGGTWTGLSDGGKISGATTNILSISNLTTNDSGNYRVIVSNGSQAVTNEAQLLVFETSPHALIGRWLAGEATLNDVSGYTPAGTHNGFLVGATNGFAWSTDVPAGFTGSSADLRGSNVAVSISNSASTELGYFGTFDRGMTNSFTVAIWAKGWPTDYAPFVSKLGENGAGFQLRKWYNTLTPCLTAYGTNGVVNLTSSVDVNTNGWHHYVGIRDGTAGIRKLYVDGVLVANITNDFGPMVVSPVDNLVLGGKHQNGSYTSWSPIQLYDARIYGYALSATELSGINHITNPPVLLSPLASQGAITGDTVQFIARADGAQLSYQWQKWNGSTYANLANGGNISGVTSSILTLANVSVTDAGSYRITVSNPVGSTNSTASLTVESTAPALIGHWLSGSQSLADTSGFTPAGTHDGQFVGDGTQTWVQDTPSTLASFSGKYALDLSGGNCAVAITNSASTDSGYALTFDRLLTNSFTAAVWVKGWPTNGYAPFVSKNGEGTTGFQLRKWYTVQYPTFTVRSGTNPGELNNANAPITNTNTWHHLVGTRDGSTGIRKLYVDSALVAVSTNDFGPMGVSTIDHLMLGGKQQNGGGYGAWAQVKLFDAQMYNYALTEAQISSLNGITNPPTFLTPLLSQSVFAGTTVQFVANLDGIQLSCQWQKLVGGNWVNLTDGGKVSGSTSNVLTLASVSSGDAASYQVLVTNPVGSTNAVAHLTVENAWTPALVGRWLSGAQSLTDSSGFAPAGTHDGFLVGSNLAGAVWSSDVPTNLPGFSGGYSLDLSAGNVAVAISNTAASDPAYAGTFDLLLTNSLTVAVWVKGWPTNGYGAFVSKKGEASGQGTNGFQLRQWASYQYPTFTVRSGTNTAELANTNAPITDSTVWHHLVGTRDGSTGVRNLYVDSVLVASTNNDFGPLGAALLDHLVLGARQQDGDGLDHFAQVKLFDVRVYDYALNIYQIENINGIWTTEPPPAPKPSPITYSVVSGQLSMNWSNGVLQSTTALRGTNTVWVTEPGSSPLTVPLKGTTGNKFYRVLGQ